MRHGRLIGIVGGTPVQIQSLRKAMTHHSQLKLEFAVVLVCIVILVVID